MTSDYQIVEYYNPCFPDTPHFRCTIKGITYHNTNLGKVVEWRQDQIVNAKYYEELKQRSDAVCAEFMKDVKYKD